MRAFISSSVRPNCLALFQTGFRDSSKFLSTIFFKITVSSIAIARIFSPFFILAALRTLAGITTCPLEEILVVDASTNEVHCMKVRTFLLKSLMSSRKIIEECPQN